MFALNKHHACSSSSLSRASSLTSAVPQVQHVLLSPLHLCLFLCLLLATFATCVLLCVPACTFSELPVSFAYSFEDSSHVRFMIRWSPFFAQTFAVIIRGHSGFHWRTRVDLLLSGCRDSGYRVDKVVPRNLKFNKHSSNSIMTVRLFSSSLILPNLNIACLVGERPQDIVALLHVFGSISFTDVADQYCVC